MPELRASHHHSRSYFSSYTSSSSPHMKLLPRRTHLHHPHHHYEKALYLKKYSKWLLWLGLSIYLFSSSSSTLFPRPTLTSLSKTTLPLKTTPRALIEARNTSAPPPFKIYVYDLPSSYNRDWLTDRRCVTHLFAAEVALHEAFLDFPRRAFDPNDADFFFVPVYAALIPLASPRSPPPCLRRGARLLPAPLLDTVKRPISFSPSLSRMSPRSSSPSGFQTSINPSSIASLLPHQLPPHPTPL